MLKLLILDRDGVINYDSDAYIKSVAEWIPLPGSIEAIAQLSKAGWTVAIATNQSGIARGYYDIPTLDPIVDLYNAISLEYAIPVGGENAQAYMGPPRLVVAEGTEPFDTTKEGTPAYEYPDPGEVVWRDEKGVTCRRWNWRQGARTRLDADARHMWFILESLPAMPLEALTEAGDKLIEGLQRMMPGVQIERSLIGPGAS